MNEDDMKEALETFIDTQSLTLTLTLLDEICGEKAEHVRSAWQDDALAKEWEKASKLIDAVADKTAEMEPPIGD